MTTNTATQAITWAQMTQPDLFRLLKVELGLTPEEMRAQEALFAPEVLYGGNAPPFGFSGY